MMISFPELISRMVHKESGGNPNAVSPVGASGLMQVMPATAADPGFGVQPLAWEDVFDPTKNRRFGESYMTALLDHFGGDQARALVAYNWGAGNATKWDGELDSLPAETRGYVEAILGGPSRPTGFQRGPGRVENSAPSWSPRPVARPAGTEFPTMFAATQPAPAPTENVRMADPTGVNLAALLEEIANASNFR